jgi:hypothetical protein
MLKGRYLYDAWNGRMSIMARPELTWFWIRDRDPFINISLSYPYVTVLWHATPDLGIELAGAYKTTVWSTSASW